MIMRQAAPASRDILQPKVDRCACGGSCPRCREQLPIQKELPISDSGARLEREADVVADKVMRMANKPLPVSTDSSGLQRACAACEQTHDEAQLQQINPAGLNPAATQSTTEIAFAPASVHEVLNSAGQFLDERTRVFFESRFGYDFSGVRVHTGVAAENSARDINARAYTVGQHVVLGAGQFAPATSEGQRLVAHELSHIVQQTAETSSSGMIRNETGTGASEQSGMLRTNKPRLQRSDPSIDVAPTPTRMLMVLNENTSLLDAADAGTNDLAKLPKGTSVTLVSTEGEWYRVEVLLNGQSLSGFIKLGQAQPPQALEGATITDYVGHTFAGVLGAKIDIAWAHTQRTQSLKWGSARLAW